MTKTPCGRDRRWNEMLPPVGGRSRWLGALVAFAMLACGPPAVDAEPIDDRLPVAAGDWPWWRGPTHDGVADPHQEPPLSWSETDHVVWKAEVPGRGHGSPIVVGDDVYLPTCGELADVQAVVCFDRRTGRQKWLTQIHSSGAMRKNERSTAASSTIACDGERLYVSFPNGGAVVTTALDRAGKQVWQTKVSDYVIHQGFGASPFLYQSLVFIAVDHHGGGVLAALERESGRVVWRQPRPKAPNYPSPVVLRAAGRDQLIMTGCDLISSFEPLTGTRLWEVAGGTTECVTTTVTDGAHVYSTGGFPRNHMTAVAADGSAKIVWENDERIYVPSFVIRAGYLYGVLDAGLAACWKADTGRQMWKARLDGNFSASLVLVRDKIFAVNEAGKTFVFEANPTRLVRLAANQLGEEVFATPAICGGQVFMRVAFFRDDARQEMLYCLGQSAVAGE